MNPPLPTLPPIDLTESAAGEEDPGAGIELPEDSGAADGGSQPEPADQKVKPSLRKPA